MNLQALQLHAFLQNLPEGYFFYFGFRNTFEYNKCTFVPEASCFDLICKIATELTFYESAGTAAACLPAEGDFFFFTILAFKILLSIINTHVLLLTRHEYTLSIELCGSGFEAGLSA